MIDLHCHILPGVDDGSASEEESCMMAEAAAESGVTVIAATPHCNVPGSYQNLDPADLRRRLDTLRALNVQVRPVGGKLRINILLDCDADFTPLCGKYPQVRIDGEDGETMLVLPLEGGGGA